MSLDIKSHITQIYAPKIKAVEKVMEGGFYTLKFPSELEKEFVAIRDANAAKSFRYRYIFIFFLYLLLYQNM